MPIDKRQLLLRGLTRTGGLRLLQSASAWSGLVVLNYHRIGSGENSLFDGLCGARHSMISSNKSGF